MIKKKKKEKKINKNQIEQLYNCLERKNNYKFYGEKILLLTSDKYANLVKRGDSIFKIIKILILRFLQNNEVYTFLKSCSKSHRKIHIISEIQPFLLDSMCANSIKGRNIQSSFLKMALIQPARILIFKYLRKISRKFTGV